MADKDFSKLQKFVEAAISNPLHPVYKMGLNHSPMLQNYAINVWTLESMKPEQWFTDYPKKTALLEEVMALCEEKDEQAATTQTDFAALIKRIDELEARLSTQPADKKAAETKTEEIPADTSTDSTPEA